MAFVGKVNTGDVTGSIGSTLYGVCSTQANVAKKEVSIPGLDTLLNGLTIHVKFTNSNRASNPTLVIPTISSAEIPIYRYGATVPEQSDRGSWPAGSVLTLTYDGAAWQINDWQNAIYPEASQSTPGLMSATDKANLDELVTVVPKRTKTLAFENVQTSAWTADATYTDYPYKATLPCTGVTSSHFVYVCFNPHDAITYVPAPVAQSGTDSVTVWVMINPGAALTVPSVLAILPDRS